MRDVSHQLISDSDKPMRGSLAGHARSVLRHEYTRPKRAEVADGGWVKQTGGARLSLKTVALVREKDEAQVSLSTECSHCAHRTSCHLLVLG